ncbi:MAG: hypothetical protein ABI379_11840 [Rhodanobacter sp.]
MKRIVAIMLAITLGSPAGAAAACHEAAARDLHGDLAGVQSVRVELHDNQVHLHSGVDPGFVLTGQACASERAALNVLNITQRRSGNQLALELGSQSQLAVGLSGGSLAQLDISMQCAARMPVLLDVGAGTADVTGMQRLQALVGSGSLQVRDVGRRSVRVGSGAVVAKHIGELETGAVGSGSLMVAGVRGNVHVGKVATGVVRLRRIGGKVRIAALGSGMLEVDAAGGNFSLGAKGSGKATFAGVKGAPGVPQG